MASEIRMPQKSIFERLNLWEKQWENAKVQVDDRQRVMMIPDDIFFALGEEGQAWWMEMATWLIEKPAEFIRDASCPRRIYLANRDDLQAHIACTIEESDRFLIPPNMYPSWIDIKRLKPKRCPNAWTEFRIAQHKRIKEQLEAAHIKERQLKAEFEVVKAQTEAQKNGQGQEQK